MRFYPFCEGRNDWEVALVFLLTHLFQGGVLPTKYVKNHCTAWTDGSIQRQTVVYFLKLAGLTNHFEIIYSEYIYFFLCCARGWRHLYYWDIFKTHPLHVLLKQASLKMFSEISMNALPYTLWSFPRVNGCFGGQRSIFYIPAGSSKQVPLGLSIPGHQTQLQASDFILTVPMYRSWSSFNTINWRKGGLSTQSPYSKHPWCMEISFLLKKYDFRSFCSTFLGHPVIVISYTTLSKTSWRISLFTSLLFTCKLFIRRVMYYSVQSYSSSLCPCSGFTTGRF